ncbi:MAG: hypothetical protein HN931_02715 [Desulfobacterales bacterium]|nr:hypothetical protein [Desulfobacterales bacterium]
MNQHYLMQFAELQKTIAKDKNDGKINDLGGKLSLSRFKTRLLGFLRDDTLGIRDQVFQTPINYNELNALIGVCQWNLSTQSKHVKVFGILKLIQFPGR